MLFLIRSFTLLFQRLFNISRAHSYLNVSDFCWSIALVSPLLTTCSSWVCLALCFVIEDKSDWPRSGTALVDITGDNTWASYIIHSDWVEDPPTEVWDVECPTEVCDAEFSREACSLSLIVFISEVDTDENCLDSLYVAVDELTFEVEAATNYMHEYV